MGKEEGREAWKGLLSKLSQQVRRGEYPDHRTEIVSFSSMEKGG